MRRKKSPPGKILLYQLRNRLSENRIKPDVHGRMKLHADIAHPINAQCRKKIQETIIIAFNEELERSKQPGYKPVDLDEPDYSADKHE